MPASKHVLVALSEYILNQIGFIQGLGQYVLTHPNLKLHTHVFMADPAQNRRLLRNMIQHLRPDGVLTCVLWPVADLPLPEGSHLVNIGNFQQMDCPTVISDQEVAGRLVAEHLLEQGLPHYAFAAVSGGYGAACRWQGFRQRLQEAGHVATHINTFRPRKRKVDVTDESLAAWVMHLPKPVGIHTYTLFEAARIAWACQEAGLRVPDEVALVGGQDSPALAAAWGPAISAIEFDHVKVACEGLQLLDRLMHGSPAPAAPMLIPPRSLVSRMSSDVQSARDPEVARLRQWLRENIHRPMTVKNILAHTDLSRRTLERRFAAIFGRSPHDEIGLLRMERAQALLRDTDLTLAQVAAQSGYANYMTFALAFRRSAGMTASAFRRRADLAAVARPDNSG
jgi:LacI family transcriptional regulator